MWSTDLLDKAALVEWFPTRALGLRFKALSHQQTEMKPVFGYLRVSGKGQLEGDGFARQKQTINDYCATHNFFVLRWFSDGGVSGEVDAAERASFGEMLLLAGPATSQTIVVERADRLARTLMVSELACEEARKSGLTILEAASDTDLTNSDDPTRVLIRQVLGALSEWNKNVLVQKLAKARARKRVATGRCEGRKPVDHRATLEIIYDLRAQGLSLRKTAYALSKRRIKTSQGGTFWEASSVKYLLDQSKTVKPNPALLAGLPI